MDRSGESGREGKIWAMQSTVTFRISTAEDNVQRVLNRLKLKAQSGFGDQGRFVDASRDASATEPAVRVRVNVESVDPSKQELSAFVATLEDVMKQGGGIKVSKIAVTGVNPL